MKRSPIKRTAPKLRRSRLRQVGQRAGRDAEERAAFQQAVWARVYCERCGCEAKDPQAHHLCTRARGVGLALLHDPEANGALLCGTRDEKRCHDAVHSGSPDHDTYLKDRRWLERGGRLQTKENTR